MIITITLNPAIDRKLILDKSFAYGKTNRAVHSTVEPGGKGIQVSRAVKALGGESVALGFTAGSNGRYFRDAVTAMDIHHDFVDVPGQTRVNILIIDPTGTHTDFNEPGYKISDADFLRFLERVNLYLDEKNIFVISGALPADFPVTNFKKLCKVIKNAGCKLIIDAEKQQLLDCLAYHPDFIKPNVIELSEATGMEIHTPEDALEGAKKLLEMGAEGVCVSMHEEGALFITKDHAPVFAKTDKHQTTDNALGTGDAMVGAIACALNQGMGFDDMARFAYAMNRASANLEGLHMANLKRVFETSESIKLYTF